jgi:hypothetical protein
LSWHSSSRANQNHSNAHRDHGNNAAVLNRNLMAALNAHPNVVFPDIHQETMMKYALIGAAAVAAVASVTPAMAQSTSSNPGYCAQFYPNVNCQNLAPGSSYGDDRDDWRNAMALQALDNNAYRYHGGPKYND